MVIFFRTCYGNLRSSNAFFSLAQVKVICAYFKFYIIFYLALRFLCFGKVFLRCMNLRPRYAAVKHVHACSYANAPVFIVVARPVAAVAAPVVAGISVYLRHMPAARYNQCRFCRIYGVFSLFQFRAVLFAVSQAVSHIVFVRLILQPVLQQKGSAKRCADNVI